MPPVPVSIRLALLAVLALQWPLGVWAQPAASAPATVPAALYESFGARPGIERLVNDFVERLRTDARTAEQFRKASPRHLKAQLADQFCQLAGGPCVLDGPDMKTAHEELQIRKADFHALVEVLQESMDAQGIPFTAQRRMLALLAPMHRDIVNVR